MKNLSTQGFFLFLLTFFSGLSIAQCPTGAGDATISCGVSTPLTATTTFTNFTLTTSPCPPVAVGGTDAFSPTCDDCVTGQIPIGFPFNYFGNTYTTAVIQSNGIVGFGAFTFTGFSSFAIPAGGAPNNYIAGMFADIDIRYGGTIKYQTIGVAPNRRFVVSYTNVVPYNMGSAAGTGTASFQIILNENGSFNISISQLSANWNASTSGALATSGCENLDGTYAVPVAGRNATDWPGIVPGTQDCATYSPVVCSFLRWQQGATILSTNPNYSVSPTATTIYTGYWNCGGTTCSDDVTIAINSSITPGSPTNNTNCTSANGAIPFTTTLPNGTYTLNYTLNGTPTSTSVTVSGNAFTLSGLGGGTYANFSITSGGCVITAAGPITLTTPPLPTTGSVSICQGGAGTITTSTCGTPGITTAQSTVFNSGTLAAGDPLYDRGYTGTTCGVTGSGNVYYYDVYSFYVSTAGSYTFAGCFPVIDSYGFIFQNAFTPATPCGTPANWVVGDDDGNGATCSLDPLLTATLTPGIQYFLVSTTYGSGSTDSYSWTFTGPAGATIATSLGSSIQWYTAASGGSSIGSTSPFNPVGVAGSGLANTNTPGTYTYYAACSSSPSCRTATPFVISAASVAPTSITGAGTICQGQSVTLGITGGTLALGANWNWYTGSCGGTLVGTGATLTVMPTTTTTYYIGATAGTSCPASGCISATVTLPPAGTTLANNGESATCLVNQNGYVHFYHSSGRLICSINSNGQNLGNVTATAYVGVPVDVPACNAPSYVATVMGREWLINPQFQPAAGVDVVLHFDNAEYTVQATQANANSSPYDNLASIADLKLSKYSGPLNMDNNALNNCVASGGSGGTTIHNQAANGTVASMLPGFSATGRFARFNIPSFSEFWLHGSTNLSPLPVELTSFSASCLNLNRADIEWSTESEESCNLYTVESSVDFVNWSEVGQQVCLGGQNTPATYHMIDENRQIGITYYRLIQKDINGVQKVYDPILLSCSTEGWSVTSHPNPADETISIVINTNIQNSESTIQLYDFAGRLVKSQVAVSTGNQTMVPLDVKALSNGPYSLRVTSADQQVETIKVIIQH